MHGPDATYLEEVVYENDATTFGEWDQNDIYLRTKVLHGSKTYVYISKRSSGKISVHLRYTPTHMKEHCARFLLF
ncbi:MAG: hypothetical protein AB2693_23390, partial [Candidatus Thiodiazotropha sp.]